VSSVLNLHHVKVIKGEHWGTVDIDRHIASLSTTKISIQQPDNVGTLVITLAVAAANFFAHVAVLLLPS